MKHLKLKQKSSLKTIPNTAQVLENYYSSFFSKLTLEQIRALHAYQGINHDRMNTHLRTHPVNLFPNNLQNITTDIHLLDQVFSKVQTPVPLTVYRGVDTGHNFNDLQRQEEGQPCVIDPGFTSTTLDIGKALSFCHQENNTHTSNNTRITSPILLKIHVPQGSQILWMDMLEDIDEQEFLIVRNSTYKVLHFEKQTNPISGASIQTVELQLVIKTI